MAKHGKTITETIMRLDYATRLLTEEINKCLDVYKIIKKNRKKKP